MSEEETAREARCALCGVTILDSPDREGTVFVNYYLPALGERNRLFLCGKDGLGLLEYLAGER